MFWLLALLGLGAINENTGRAAKAQEDFLYIMRFGPEAFEKKRKREAFQQRLSNATFVFLLVLGVSWALGGCAPIVPSYAYHASYMPNDPCGQYLTGRVSNDYVNCHAQIRQAAEKQREEQLHLAEIKAYHEADRTHSCTSLNPDG